MAEVWIFAYGSLMWNPGFAPRLTEKARLHGWHRAMCILSNLYRGTVQQPGLVLGLDRGGSCWGKAFAVAHQDWPQVKAQLDARELPTAVYDARFLPVTLSDGQKVHAYAYVVRRNHPQYWSGDEAQSIQLIRNGIGKAGRSRDYLAQTVQQLQDMQVPCPALAHLLLRVDGAENRGQKNAQANGQSVVPYTNGHKS